MSDPRGSAESRVGRPPPRPRWWGWFGTAIALYGLVLLTVFVSWHAAIIGCLIASGASEATRGRA